MRLSPTLLLALAIPLLGGWGWLTRPDPDVATGNRSFSEGRFRAALESYQRARTHGDGAAVQYDIGSALYKLAAAASDPKVANPLLDRAEDSFRRAARSSDPVLRSAAEHNLGNTLFLRERYGAAVKAYRKALEANQDNDDARYNLELALRRLEGGRRAPQPGAGQPGQNGQRGQRGQPPDPGDPLAGQPGQPDAQSGDPGRSGAPPGGAAPEFPGAGDQAETHDRKLDALENRSRELRRRQLRRGNRSGSSRLGAEKDW